MRSGLLELLRQEKWDPGAIGYVVKALEKAVRRSMILEPMRIGSADTEQNRRVLMAIELFRIMTGDLKWGPRRAADLLEVHLLQKVRGQEVNFSNRAAWVGPGTLPEGGSDDGPQRSNQKGA
jgi:hypothetical protein